MDTEHTYSLVSDRILAWSKLELHVLGFLLWDVITSGEAFPGQIAGTTARSCGAYLHITDCIDKLGYL